MHVVHRYDSVLEARAAALVLLEHGIAASVHHVIEPFDGMLTPILGGGVEVQLFDKADKERATELLDVLAGREVEGVVVERLDMTFDPATVEPDLGLLEDQLWVTCRVDAQDRRDVMQSGCGRPVLVEANEQACEACGLMLDMVERVIAEHGPEVLVACYPPPEPILSDEAVERIGLRCFSCGYALRGLALVGVCPECATAYDKHAMVEELLF